MNIFVVLACLCHWMAVSFQNHSVKVIIIIYLPRLRSKKAQSKETVGDVTTGHVISALLFIFGHAIKKPRWNLNLSGVSESTNYNTCNLYMAIMCGLYKHLCISLLEIHLMCDSCKLMANIILFHLCCCYVMLTVCVCFCSHFIVIYIQFHICRRHLICLVLLSRHQLPQLLQKVLFLWMPYMSQSHLVALSRRQLQRLL